MPCILLLTLQRVMHAYIRHIYIYTLSCRATTEQFGDEGSMSERCVAVPVASVCTGRAYSARPIQLGVAVAPGAEASCARTGGGPVQPHAAWRELAPLRRALPLAELRELGYICMRHACSLSPVIIKDVPARVPVQLSVQAMDVAPRSTTTQ